MGNSLQTLIDYIFEDVQEQDGGGVHDQEVVEDHEEDHFTCGICFEEVSLDKRFKNSSAQARRQNDANADHTFCTDCIGKYIKVQVDDRLAHLNCPAPGCNDRLHPLSCRQLLAATTFEKWCDNLRDAYLLGKERCHCPCRDCNVAIVNECGGDVRISKCPKCKRLFCFKCAVPWHGGYTCEERRDMRNVNDVLLEQLMERNKWIRCPKCGHGVERRSGCPRMRCRCRTRFCYNCGQERCICRNSQVTTRVQAANNNTGVVIAFLFVLVCVVVLLIQVLYTSLVRSIEIGIDADQTNTQQ